jgi:dihydrofolate reductase
LIDELQIHLVPVLLGDGARLFDHVAAPRSGSNAPAQSRPPASPTSPTAS